MAPHATPFVSALVFAYTTFTTADAISSFPDEACNPSLANTGVAWTVLSCAVAAVSIGYIASCINRWTQSATQMATGGVGKTDGSEVKVEMVDESAAATGEALEPQSFAFYHREPCETRTPRLPIWSEVLAQHHLR